MPWLEAACRGATLGGGGLVLGRRGLADRGGGAARLRRLAALARARVRHSTCTSWGSMASRGCGFAIYRARGGAVARTPKLAGEAAVPHCVRHGHQELQGSDGPGRPAAGLEHVSPTSPA
ncbi:hypothetical protein SETIT_6G071400v2 [Setaria italica]|uniref:Uncharacterized protein n=1 Tax=Setaria italica TaxID=4555 RepID=A0A368RJ43_SETIT|nr:hypothetical protein SETIT_6G071400v2 [Setaria italica]